MGCGASSESQHDSLEMYEMEDEMEERVRRKHIQQTATQDTFLPPQEDAVSGKKTLVLDMDETLLHSSPTEPEHFDFTVTVKKDVGEGKATFWVLKRPGVDEFLAQMHEMYEIVIFTASTQRYADAVLNAFSGSQYIHHRLYRQHCTSVQWRTVKDLGRLGRDLRGVIIVDDTPECYFLHPKNAFPIARFVDDMTDSELVGLADRLESVVDASDVRKVAF
uniref:FCP1 homology domain-containing protein n=1 Tax=Palpitomonas bilix TaxID=652834 RepID=A0A7S3DL54_9EUKA|mmetsp:Transcript_42844/g.110482  ORF Transcript_42844/g.110482 Transcript_42844/m.110482 type:complete len:220 (+) Transcript_42844:468-1127(+)|eukprot:CAMPEP_0113880452 /NCGR_PEP_ID=MMETSP0780_2-20120614/7795_1 /TAXON_ID=652834 /ORGANISM="Palpitomonas bilix" /LENGTH=219 /DNA_ID=CAMNT_0000867133 /DNA_START=466 /DNA_END=1125 /DNA_ORIENTATION=+ /assembly_acc=CAM_ASM_000599